MDTLKFISKIEGLPASIQSHIMDYIDYLLAKYGKGKKSGRKFKFDWEDDLADLKGQYTSVELQHRINNLR